MKKLLATLLASTMALTTIGGLVACGGDDYKDNPNLIIVWAPENSFDEETKEGYSGMIEGWKEAYPEYANMEVKFVAKGEGDVNGALGNNPKAGAEIFFFASDHYKDLVQNKALQPLTAEYVEKVHARDAQGTYEFVTDAKDNLYAFPTTNDNGYFLWYNDEILDENDVKSLDTILEKCSTYKRADGGNGVHVNFPYKTAWYSGSFLMGMGCKFNYDENGRYQSDAGTAAAKGAAKAMWKYANGATNKAVVVDDVKKPKTKTDVICDADFKAGLANGTMAAAISYVSAYTDIETAVRNHYTNDSGAVNEDKVDNALSHIKATTLPKFKATVDGETQEKEYYMGTFYGGKYCGVNKSKPEAKILAALTLADWFTNEEGQKVRFDADGSGPSNLNVAQLEKVQNSIGLKAYNAQVALGTQYNCVQGKQKDSYWNNINVFAQSVFEHTKTDDVDYTTEAGVLAQLAKIADNIDKNAK